MAKQDAGTVTEGQLRSCGSCAEGSCAILWVRMLGKSLHCYYYAEWRIQEMHYTFSNLCCHQEPMNAA